eukprot:11157597-Karenia_brevis.AAC.1
MPYKEDSDAEFREDGRVCRFRNISTSILLFANTVGAYAERKEHHAFYFEDDNDDDDDEFGD